jgi:hypothetical protein
LQLAALRQHPRLSYDLLFSLATKHFHLHDITSRIKLRDLINVIVEHIAGYDDAYKEAIAAAYDEEKNNSVSWLANDPLFEATFEEMSPDDRRERNEVSDEISKAKVKRRVASQQGGRNTRPRLLPKAKAKAKAKPHPAPPAPVAEPAPPPPAAEPAPHPRAADPASPPPPPPPLDEALPLVRSDRGIPFGRRFVLAEVWPSGVLKAWSAKCNIHAGGLCNKTLSMGTTYTPAQAKHRIMEWCVRGYDIPDIPGIRKRTLHMEEEPKDFIEADVRSVEALTLRAAD